MENILASEESVVVPSTDILNIWKIEKAVQLLRAELEKNIPNDVPSWDPEREKLAKRQANAAVALTRLGEMDRVLPLLTHSPDPSLRSYIIHALAPKVPTRNW